MTGAQYRLFWREWQACRKWLIEHGRDPKQADAARSKLTKEALGYERSMTDWPSWKNAEFDKVIAKFRSVYDGGNLDAQIHAEEQPEERMQTLTDRCFKAIADSVGPDDEARERYLNGLSQRVAQKRFVELDERGLQKICGIVETRAKARREKLNTNPF